MNIYNLYDHDLVAEPEAGGLRLRGEDQGAHDYAGGTAGVRGHTGVHGTRGKTGRCLCQIGEVVKSSVADLVQFFPDPVFKIRIRVTRKRPDPTGSGTHLDMFLMFSKKVKKLYGIFILYLNIL